MTSMSLRESMIFGYLVGGMLMLFVVLRTLVGGYAAGRFGAGDLVMALVVAGLVIQRRRAHAE